MQKLLASLCALVLALLSVEAIAGTVTYFHNDALGSPISATDDRGVVIWKESYRPYGDRLTNSASASGNKIWFTSRRRDPETGLVYMGARFYDPAAGRFVSTDQVGFAEKNVQSFNRYAYANDNPYKYADPNGKSPLIAWGVGGYGAGVLADAASQYAAWGSVDWKLALSSSAAQMGAFAGLLGAADSVGLTIERVGAEGIGATEAGAINTTETAAAAANKLNHIFGKAEHNLGPLVDKFGTKEATFNAVQSATQRAVDAGNVAGVFETTVTVAEQNVVVRGNVIDGVARIGTFYIP